MTKVHDEADVVKFLVKSSFLLLRIMITDVRRQRSVCARRTASIGKTLITEHCLFYWRRYHIYTGAAAAVCQVAVSDFYATKSSPSVTLCWTNKTSVTFTLTGGSFFVLYVYETGISRLTVNCNWPLAVASVQVPVPNCSHALQYGTRHTLV